MSLRNQPRDFHERDGQSANVVTIRRPAGLGRAQSGHHSEELQIRGIQSQVRVSRSAPYGGRSVSYELEARRSDANRRIIKEKEGRKRGQLVRFRTTICVILIQWTKRSLATRACAR